MRKLLALGLLLAVTMTANAKTVTELNRVVAVVNDDIITADELAERTQLNVLRLQKNKTPPPPREVIEKNSLEQLILERVQILRAAEIGIRVEESDINWAIAETARQNNITVDQLRQTLEKEGKDYAEFRRTIGNERLIVMLREREVMSRVMITPQEVENFLSSPANTQLDTEYHIAHIIISIPEAATPEQLQAAKDKAGKVLFQLRAGADFGQMAATYSSGQQSVDGGDLGWRKGAELPWMFGEAVAALKQGQISDLIRSPNGFHILKLLGVRGDAKQVVQQIHARHILVSTNQIVSDTDAKVKLQRLRDRILHGEDFGELARANSDHKSSVATGGDLGWVNPGQLGPEFDRMLKETPIGKLSEPFRSPLGWHILQPMESREYDNTDQYRRARAAEILRRRKTEETGEIWLQQLRDEAYVEYRLE